MKPASTRRTRINGASRRRRTRANPRVLRGGRGDGRGAARARGSRAQGAVPRPCACRRRRSPAGREEHAVADAEALSSLPVAALDLEAPRGRGVLRVSRRSEQRRVPPCGALRETSGSIAALKSGGWATSTRKKGRSRAARTDSSRCRRRAPHYALTSSEHADGVVARSRASTSSLAPRPPLERQRRLDLPPRRRRRGRSSRASAADQCKAVRAAASLWLRVARAFKDEGQQGRHTCGSARPLAPARRDEPSVSTY